jgi:sulfatase modifying factor 1
VSVMTKALAFVGGFWLAAAVAQPPGTGAAFKDCDDCPDMVVVPAGTFMMGSSPEETEREGVPELSRGDPSEWERPRHEVDIRLPFAVGRTEVTVAQFRRFVVQTNRNVPNDCVAHWPGTPLESAERVGWAAPGYPQEEDFPVVCLRWDDAVAYAEWLSAQTGKRYRLPSEAEWEYVARAGTVTARYWGDARAAACAFENVPDRALGDTALIAEEPYASMEQRFACDDGFKVAAPVARLQPNPFGVFDTIGNAREWVRDCMHPSYDGAPSDGSAWESDCEISDRKGRIGQLMRVRRGAGWNYLPHGTRSARRGAYPSGTRSWTLGFRLARDLDIAK